VGVERWIREHLLPQAEQTRDEMQHEVDGAVRQVQDCGNLLWSAEKEVEHRENILLKDESGKYQCVAREHQLSKSELEKCKDLTSFAASLSPPPSVNDAEKNPSAMKEAITMNHAFYTSAYPQFMTFKQACDQAHQAMDAQKAECDADEAAIEDFYCTMKSKRDEACVAYDQCYEEKSEAMTKKIKKIRELETTTKEHFQSMACAGEAFSEGSGDSQEGDQAECDPNAYETNHLDVNYPAAPLQQTCISIMETGRRDYSAIVCDGDAAASGGANETSTLAPRPSTSGPPAGTTPEPPAGTTPEPPAASTPEPTAAPTPAPTPASTG
jgi:hypothetical protein